jgi:hypothetical protein
MRFTIYISISFLLFGLSIFAEDSYSKERKTKKLPVQKEAKEVDVKKENKETSPEKETKAAANAFTFRGQDLGGLWAKVEKTNQLIYSPDSMRQTNKYKKFVFDLNEFKKMGGNLDREANFKIHFSVLQTDIESSTPSDPNMPSPSGGFTYIINTCKIEKIEAN